MKKTFYLLSLVLLSNSMQAQKTYIPDDNFEQILINLNLDDIFDDSKGNLLLILLQFYTWLTIIFQV